MAYEQPKVVEISMEVSQEQIDFGMDTQEKCSRHCCFGGGTDW